MAENNISATELNRNLSVSRVNSRVAEEQAERQARVVNRQENSQAIRDQNAVETQTGRTVNIRT
jgi:hypothetical protein